MHPEIGNIVELVQFWTGSEYVNLQNVYEKVWKRVFLDTVFGPCYTFDLSKVDKFKYVPLKTASRPGIQFVMVENNIWQVASLMLHTRFDLPDAFQLYGYLALSFANQYKSKKVYKVELRKKIIKRESTRRAPCGKYERYTCQSIEDNTSILERFHCSVLILYTGQHLDNVIPKGTNNCSQQVTLEALDFILKKKSNCTMSQTCQNTRFTSNLKIQESWLENKTLVYVTFENPEVEYHHSYISYDLISLIGEIGGILGITLGASALTFFESLLRRVPYF